MGTPPTTLHPRGKVPLKGRFGMTRMRTGIIGLVLLSAGAMFVLTTAGCNTVEGMGTDLRMAGESMRDSLRPTP